MRTATRLNRDPAAARFDNRIIVTSAVIQAQRDAAELPGASQHNDVCRERVAEVLRLVQAAAQALSAKGYKTLGITCDVSDDAQMEATVKETESRIVKLR